MGFLVGKGHDTRMAWYRIDDGAPVRWQDRTAALIAADVEIDGPALDNPTGGWVWIPFAEVVDRRRKWDPTFEQFNYLRCFGQSG